MIGILSVVASLVFTTFGAVLIAYGRRAATHPRASERDFPRWAIRLTWILGIELALFGAALGAAIIHALFVYASMEVG